jgi:hypothetical protein
VTLDDFFLGGTLPLNFKLAEYNWNKDLEWRIRTSKGVDKLLIVDSMRFLVKVESGVESGTAFFVINRD